jgi:hypothetical protein
MSKCKCDLRTKLVGDGCRYCNAQEYIDKLIEALEEQRTWVGLTDKDWNRSKHTEDFEKGVDWAEEMLKGKNT